MTLCMWKFHLWYVFTGDLNTNTHKPHRHDCCSTSSVCVYNTKAAKQHTQSQLSTWTNQAQQTINDIIQQNGNIYIKTNQLDMHTLIASEGNVPKE